MKLSILALFLGGVAMTVSQDYCPDEASNMASCFSNQLASDDASKCDTCIANAVPQNPYSVCEDFNSELCPAINNCGCGQCEDEIAEYAQCILTVASGGQCSFTCDLGSSDAPSRFLYCDYTAMGIMSAMALLMLAGGS